MRRVVSGRLHGIPITEANLSDHGSITPDSDHCEGVGFAPMEFVEIWNKNSGARISTYVVLGERRSGCCILNGAVARTCRPGDQVIICTSVYIPESHITEISPRILAFDRNNQVAERLSYQTSRDAQGCYCLSILDDAGISRPVSLVTATSQ